MVLLSGRCYIDKVKWPINIVLKSIVLSSADAERKEDIAAGKAIEEQGNPLKQDHCDREAIKPLLETVRATV